MTDGLAQRIISRPDLLARWAPPRTARLVFTNGVFDVLHRGHVEYLHAARAMGDALVVAINTDASVRRLKGAGRPLNRELDRACVLAALRSVDAVTLFDEDTPQELLASLLPDVLVKGGDYAPDQVVGRDIVEAHGGRLAIIPVVTGHSTTAIIERMRGS
jgi:D-beta-D-heptose 7-phosphate kinase/D-beta-D-heptose 1-phosphate adenosyltransferase